ncbi:MAG: proton-conducting transporter transmembrane domain-containing protein [Bacilli bacterium]
MIALFWTTVLMFLIVPPIAIATEKLRNIGFFIWIYLAVACFGQFVFGLVGLVAGATIQIAAIPGIGIFGSWTFAADPLGDLLFIILGLIGTASFIYAGGHARLKRPGTSYVLMSVVAAQYVFISFLLTAQNGLPMLITWEAMSLCAYAYVLVNHRQKRVRHSAFVTLVASELGFLLLVAAFVLAATPGGSLEMLQMHVALVQRSESTRAIIFLLALFGFGVKSGVVPMQLWMPAAYDVTPPHLNAVLAGALLNLGLFGILRVYSFTFPLPEALGIAVVGLGAVGVFGGALYAVFEGRIRRILAFSSIENVGFMIMAIGMVISFSRAGSTRFAAVAMTALFVQMISHALAKSLCFLSAGEISRRTGRVQLDRLGGLWRVFPASSIAFLVGSLTLAAVAPFSGFVSEWLIFQSLLQAYQRLTGFEQAILALFGAVAALGAAMAFTAFLRLIMFIFSGRARSDDVTQRAAKTRASRTAGAGMALLAVLSALYGFFPTLFLGTLSRVVANLPPHRNVFSSIVPAVFQQPALNQPLVALGGRLFSFLPMPGAIVEPGDGVAAISPTYLLWWFMVFGLLAFIASRTLRRGPYRRRYALSWLGGRAREAQHAQYTATAYANPYRMYFASLIHFRIRRRFIAGDATLPLQVEVTTQVRPQLESDVYQPLLRRSRKFLSRGLRWIQHGYLWAYLAFMLLVLLLFLIWALLMN